jgi:hypothetical protein
MEASRTSDRISTALVLLWITPGLAVLYILGGMILGKPGFHLGLGLINITGKPGLLFTVVPALLGTAAVLLLFRARELGARLLTVYCAFWFLNFLGGLIHNWNDIVISGGIFNGPTGMRIGVGLMIVFFLGSFLLCGIWGWRRSRIAGTR